MDLKPVLNETASRLLHIKHPRMITEYARLKSLQNAVHMLPSRQQTQSNRMGDSYSKKESLRILEKISEDYTEPILAFKTGVESLYLGGTANLSKRSRFYLLILLICILVVLLLVFLLVFFLLVLQTGSGQEIQDSGLQLVC